jgi:hypothetical protein
VNKRYALHKLFDFGDAIISLRNGRSFLATIDFKNKYISKFKRKRISQENMRFNILVFNWTANKYEEVDAKEIVYMTPLARILNNESPELIREVK